MGGATCLYCKWRWGVGDFVGGKSWGKSLGNPIFNIFLLFPTPLAGGFDMQVGCTQMFSIIKPAFTHSLISRLYSKKNVSCFCPEFRVYSRLVNRASPCKVLRICLISWVRSFLTTRVTLRSRTITTSSNPIVTMTSSGFVA